jgi:4-alpha-glucanotransferase
MPAPAPTPEPAIDRGLADLAAEYGVATEYANWRGQPVPVAAEVVVAVLAALGVDARDPHHAAAEARRRRAERLLPPTVVAIAGEQRTVPVAVDTATATVTLEDGTVRRWRVGDGACRLPVDLPPGWHRLEITAAARAPASTSTGRASATLVVAPARLHPEDRPRIWGWQVQLYAARSAESWGVGDYADLATLVRRSAREQGAGAVLVNPVHAVTPTVPIEASPYYPSSRRFRNPLHLRIEETAEYAAADADVKAEVARLAATARELGGGDLLDRDAVWSAKLGALALLYAGSRSPARAAAMAAFADERGAGLRDFATFCALAERHGPTWHDWPPELRRPDGPAVERARGELAERVAFHAWLQLLCDEQLAAVQAGAVAAGMPVGVVHDLAVGVDPNGADAWALQDALAGTTTVGAPPDSFNQQGQDWRLPPWRPDRLAELGYAPFRDVIRAVLRHAGGIRVDHVLGMFRLWWIPSGEPASRGTYVRYDDEAMLAVLVLEAHRAGALVVGEDLGTVEPRVHAALERRGVLGSDVLWFAREKDDSAPLPPQRWRSLAAASVTTHDLPTAAGFLAGEHVRVRAELGVLGRPVEEEQAQADREREELLALVELLGLLAPQADRSRRNGAGSARDHDGTDVDVDDVVVALHALLARTPALLVLPYLGDAAGDLRQPNLPGTDRQYPNWRLPLADAAGDPVTLDDVLGSPLAARIAAALAAGSGAAGDRS